MEANNHSDHHPLTSVLLFVLALIGDMAQDLTFDVAYNYLFKIMTLISLTLIIIINWKKMIKVFRRSNG